MGTRGRKSRHDLAATALVEATERPAPPASLGDEEKFEWLRIVNALESDHFGEGQLRLLEQYVCHIVAARHVRQLISMASDADEIDVKEFARLLKEQRDESRTMASLAVRLGFGDTAAKHQQRKATGSVPKPWE